MLIDVSNIYILAKNRKYSVWYLMPGFVPFSNSCAESLNNTEIDRAVKKYSSLLLEQIEHNNSLLLWK